MKLKFKSKSIFALVSLLVVTAAFNTVVISSNVGSKKSQLFLNGISSFCQNWNDNAPWMEGDDTENQINGPHTTYEDINYSMTISEKILKNKVLSGEIDKDFSGELSINFGTIMAKTGKALGVLLGGSTSKGSEFVVLHTLTFTKKNAEKTTCTSIVNNTCFEIDEIADFISNHAQYRDALIENL